MEDIPEDYSKEAHDLGNKIYSLLEGKEVRVALSAVAGIIIGTFMDMDEEKELDFFFKYIKDRIKKVKGENDKKCNKNGIYA